VTLAGPWWAFALLLVPVALVAYAYALYPLLLAVLGRARPVVREPDMPRDWPFISITVPAYNEERAIGATIENLLSADYPADRRQILVVSDGSTDGTDAVVRTYADRGVELLRLPVRGGKTAAENAAAGAVRAEIIINTDASVRILPDAIKPLVRAFGDPTVGVASGRDVSVGDVEAEGNRGESGYVGYEMAVRDLETRLGSIIGASGCYYGFRRAVYAADFPDALSRDFASVLIARERGFRSVSVAAARCVVPRTVSLRAEFRRKIRTMARGLATLWYKRALLNGRRYGVFAFMLFSHKLCRWLVYLAIPPALLGLVVLAVTNRAAAVLLAAAIAGAGVGLLALRAGDRRPLARPIALCGYLVGSVTAGVLAWVTFFRGRRLPMWEPTRRPV
jgi:cellulose synthase/poly-beta-1,6-N-acetylglucosamine synthase-like glycosyltransferase